MIDDDLEEAPVATTPRLPRYMASLCGCGCCLWNVVSPDGVQVESCLDSDLACEIANLMNWRILLLRPSSRAVRACMDNSRGFARRFAAQYPEFINVPPIAEWLEEERARERARSQANRDAERNR